MLHFSTACAEKFYEVAVGGKPAMASGPRSGRLYNGAASNAGLISPDAPMPDSVSPCERVFT